jgi:hypothetical protein
MTIFLFWTAFSDCVFGLHFWTGEITTAGKRLQQRKNG